jgi:DNA-binding MarR family transcriptional regulator
MAHDESDFDLAALLEAVQVFRSLDPEIQAQAVAVLLFVAMKNRPVLMGEIGEALNISQSSVSRNVAVLGELHWRGRQGLRMLDAWENPDNRRQKFVALTLRGKTFVKTVQRALSR